MVRTILCAVAFLFATTFAVADDVKKADAKKAEAKKGGKVNGKVKKIDAEKGVIVLMVGKKGEEAEKEFNVADAKFTVIISETEKKEGLAAKEGLKMEQLKEGAMVSLTMEKDKVTAVTVGQAKKKKAK